MEPKSQALELFHPLIQQWFKEKVGTPTHIQEQAWPQIAQGNHVVVTAPTGSGKTLTAFLWAINRFITPSQSPHPPRILYISPLKALNNDIQRNLEKPLEELKHYFQQAHQSFPTIRTAVRSGDTDSSQRRQMLHHPPHIFITTPESLNVLLTSPNGIRILTGFSTVILDEIHAVLPSKRGTYLISAIERLVPYCGEFQRIGLSATVNPIRTVADFIGGYRLTGTPPHYEYTKRNVSLIRSQTPKHYRLTIDFSERKTPTPEHEAYRPEVLQAWREIIRRNRSSLFFANSRRTVEKVTRWLNEGNTQDNNENETVYSHHGSLSKEIRSVVEKRFKDGELSAIVATSSLELGIDIGSVDEVVSIQAPYSISSAIQRIGRSGHGVNQVSSGIFYPLHPHGLIDAAVITPQVEKADIEPIQPLQAPLDVLAQIILSMTVPQAMDIDQLFAEIRASYPFHHLSRKEFDLVIEMLAGRYADSRIRELNPRLLVDRIKNTARARDSVPMLLYSSGGVIPDRGYFNLRLSDTKAKIGELDEEFVWERSLGDAFPFGNKAWRIQRITPNDVEVTPVSKPDSVVPFWRADDVNRSYHFSQKIGEFLEAAHQSLQSPHFIDQLQKEHFMTPQAAQELIVYLKQQVHETRAPLPHRHHILVEHFQDPVNRSDAKQTVLHTLWGGPVNRPFAYAIAAAWEEKYNYPLVVFVNNDCILLNLPHSFSISDILSLVPPHKVRTLLRNKLEGTGYFGARFRENAQRALLLPRQSFRRRMPLWLNRLRSKKLLEAVSRYEDFPILLETWRECMNHDFEIDILLNLLEEIHTQQIKITEVRTQTPSPFTHNILWRQTNQYMYADDEPHGKLKTGLSDTLLKEVMYSSHLRPRFTEELLNTFREKLHRIAPGYAPTSPDELLQWLKERLYIPHHEWEELSRAVELDQQIPMSQLFQSIEDRVHILKNEDGTIRAYIALENLSRVTRALRIPANDTSESLTPFLSQWLQFYGPVSPHYISHVLHIPSQYLQTSMENLVEDARVIIDEFRIPQEIPSYIDSLNKYISEVPQDHQDIKLIEVCDSGNLEILLRLRRSQARPAIQPLDIDAFPLFLATYHQLTSPTEGIPQFQQTIETLFGYPAKAGLWETDIFPARLKPYYNSWLDTLMKENPLVWFGCGKERISFCFENDYELFASLFDPPEPEESGEEDQQQEAISVSSRELLEKIFSQTRGKFDLADLTRTTQQDSRQLAPAIWQMAWEGKITNDNFKVLRTGIMNRFKLEEAPQMQETHHSRRFNFNRWQSSRPFAGNWYPLPQSSQSPIDALDAQELIKDRVRQLFMRYPVLFRELLWNELPLFRWSVVFPVLRLMELSGEIVSGHFFKSVPGLQFCLPSVIGLLSRPLETDAVYWMNAADPISPCGIQLEELRFKFPHRLTTTHLVFHGKQLVLVSKKNGKELVFEVQPDNPSIPRYLEFFKVLVGREFQPIKYIAVETVNQLPVLDSPYRQVLSEFGFKKDYKSLTLMKEY